MRIITDSAADLSQEYIKSHPNLTVLPLKTTYQEKSLENLNHEDFYKLLRTLDNEFPKTSQISPEEYVNEFSKYIDEGLIYISIGSGFSGSYASANIAKGILAETYDVSNLHIFDSKTLTGKQAIFVDFAYELNAKGVSVEEIFKGFEAIDNQIIFSFLVEDLKYLYAGGRLSKTEMAFGSVLGVRPILTTEDNKACAKAKVRGLKKGMNYLLDEIKDKKIKKLFIVRCEETPLFKEFLSQINIPYTILKMGPVIATHGGPECFGIAAL